MKEDREEMGYTEADAWMFSEMFDERYWDNYPLGIQHNLYGKLLSFENRAKVNMERATILGLGEDYDMINDAMVIVRYNMDELERSMAFNEDAITEQMFGTEPYCLN